MGPDKYFESEDYYKFVNSQELNRLTKPGADAKIAAEINKMGDATTGEVYPEKIAKEPGVLEMLSKETEMNRLKRYLEMLENMADRDIVDKEDFIYEIVGSLVRPSDRKELIERAVERDVVISQKEIQDIHDFISYWMREGMIKRNMKLSGALFLLKERYKRGEDVGMV